jgi:hypothetical protein
MMCMITFINNICLIVHKYTYLQLRKSQCFVKLSSLHSLTVLCMKQSFHFIYLKVI